jgi:predicted nucleic acid-binding protein
MAETAVLVDLNVILDVLQLRLPHYPASARVWAAVEDQLLQGYIAAHSVTTMFYLLNKHLGTRTTQQVMKDLLTVFRVAGVDQDIIHEALSLGWKDFEDAVQMAAAMAVGADFLITRNPKDFKGGRVALLQPAELPAILTSPQ